MSVYKALRGESTLQFLDTARQLAVHTRRYCLKMPKRYTFFGAQEVCRLADHFRVPHFVLDIPYEQTEGSVRDVAAQLREMKRFIEDHTGKTIDEAALRAAVARSQRSMAKGHNYWRIKRMDDYFMDLFGLDPRNKGAWRLAANGGQICIGSKMLPQAA